MVSMRSRCAKVFDDIAKTSVHCEACARSFPAPNYRCAAPGACTRRGGRGP